MPDRNEQVRIDITAKDEASEVIRDVAGATEKVDELAPKVDITADTESAERALKNVGEDAEDTARKLERLDGEGGLKTRGNAIADLTGPLGDASGAASDFAGVFDGIGDIAGDVAGKVGVSAAAMESAIGGIGIAVAAAAAVWTYFKGKQEEARKKQEELNKKVGEFNDAIKKGDLDAAARKFDELYGSAVDAGEQIGLSAKTIVDFITGATTEIPGVSDELKALRQNALDAVDASGGVFDIDVQNSQNALARYEELIGKVNGARDSYQEANGSIDEQNAKLRTITSALGGATTKTGGLADAVDNARIKTDLLHTAFDSLRGSLNFEQAVNNLQTQLETALTNTQTEAGVTTDDILAIKQSIIDVGEQAGKTPVEVQAELAKVTPDNLWQVASDVQSWYTQNPVTLKAKLEFQKQHYQVIGGQVVATPTALPPMPGPAPAPSTVNVNLPRGYTGNVVSEVTGAARRNGRRYGARTVRYARR